ncbi:MAG: cupin domain-containing protein [Acidobacteria bacterium]|nr:cupin domain-containing protein [Acidobacteriota bacterium]
MNYMQLDAIAEQLPKAWSSIIVAQVGASNLKVLRMDGTPYAEEVHPYPEALLVLKGQLNLTVQGVAVTVSAGGIYVVPAGIAHGVAAGSQGILVIMDAA